MILSLDRDALYDVLSGESPPVRERYEAALCDGHEFRLCATVFHDLAAAFKSASQPEKRLSALSALLVDIMVEPFTGEDAMRAAGLAHTYEQNHWRIPAGCLTAAGQAINRGWTMVTTNFFHFAGLGVPVIDWMRSDRVITAEAAVAALFDPSKEDK